MMIADELFTLMSSLLERQVVSLVLWWGSQLSALERQDGEAGQHPASGALSLVVAYVADR